MGAAGGAAAVCQLMCPMVLRSVDVAQVRVGATGCAWLQEMSTQCAMPEMMKSQRSGTAEGGAGGPRGPVATLDPS